MMFHKKNSENHNNYSRKWVMKKGAGIRLVVNLDHKISIKMWIIKKKVNLIKTK
jgi:hypothetical protein